MSSTDTALKSAAVLANASINGAAARPLVHAYFEPASHTISYRVQDPQGGHCALIDSVLDFDSASGRTATQSADKLLAPIREHALQVAWVLETHVHADHLSAAPYLREQVGGRLAIGQRITEVQQAFADVFNVEASFARDGSQFDHLFADGEQFQVGGLQAIALSVPGHTPACMAYLIGDALFVGDTLFMPDYGSARCDFPGGSASALYRSIRRLLSLPARTRVFVCHDYLPEGRSEFAWETTVAEQRSSNVHVRDGIAEDEFVSMREERDATLNMPKLILPSVQVNMRAGHLPPAEDNGTHYLKLPINAI